MIDCPHRPPCPSHVTRFVCGQRSRTEDAINRGLVTREQGLKLMARYGVQQLTPASRVYCGEKAPTETQGKLV